MLARLKGMVQSLQPEPAEDDELLPTWDATPPKPAGVIPVAVPVKSGFAPVEDIPLALPVDSAAVADAGQAVPDTVPPPDIAEPAPGAPPPNETGSPPLAPPAVCRVCGSSRDNGQKSCGDCGYYFTPEDAAPPSSPAAPAVWLRGRYEPGQLLSRHGTATRFRALDHCDGGPVPVILLSEPLTEAPKAVDAARSADTSAELEILSESESEASSVVTAVLPPRPTWPGIAWEHALLKTCEQPALPRVLDNFTEGGFEYLVEEAPLGRSLWDAWDDPEASADRRFGWLEQLAEALHSLHGAGAMFDGLRPEAFVVGEDGQARFRDLSEVLPLPLPPGTPLRGSLYAAPELLTGSADARADLFGFGALLYALHVGRELDESDFDRPGHPKPFLPRFPDVHPALGRLMAKTFRREVEARFPSDEAVREDATGFVELVRTLGTLRRTLDDVRLEVAAWSTTGMARTGNEDAFALLHACESREDDLGESALLLLADGMGGYEAGEVAAALAVETMRRYLLSRASFAPLAGASHFPGDALSPRGRPAGERPAGDVEGIKRSLREALREANREVFTAARTPGTRRRGMGCTAEAVFVDGRHVVVGHVGDSRTYHLHEGRLVQLTRDQTLVNRLVELGTLSPEEAEDHPRRNELQQAIGGQPEVEPGLYSGPMSPGDWVVVCSDGLSNHVSSDELKHMLLSEAQSAEMAARRLVNLANIRGATDNATVVVVRAS